MTANVAFIEFGAGDVDKARAFYEGLFGWQFRPGPSEQGFEIDGVGVPAGIHGGDAGAAPYVFFAVDDIEQAAERVVELGGVVEDVDVEGDAESQARFGRFKLCRDSEGSPFGLHQAPAR